MLNHIPANIFGKIGRFLDNRTILRLREVSKITSDMVSTMATLRDSTLLAFIVYYNEIELNKMCIAFVFPTEKECFTWKLFCKSSLENLGFDATPSIWGPHNFTINLATVDAENFLKFLKPHFTRLHIRGIHIPRSGNVKNCLVKIIDMCTSLLEGKSIEEHSINDLEFGHFEAWINFFIKVGVKHGGICVNKMDKGTMKFLLHSADLLASINLNFKSIDYPFDVIPLLRAMLTRKCNKIRVEKNEYLSTTEMEQLLMMLSHIDKKVNVMLQKDLDNEIEAQIGTYKLRRTTNNRHVVIAHIDFSEHTS